VICENFYKAGNGAPGYSSLFDVWSRVKGNCGGLFRKYFGHHSPFFSLGGIILVLMPVKMAKCENILGFGAKHLKLFWFVSTFLVLFWPKTNIIHFLTIAPLQAVSTVKLMFYFLEFVHFLFVFITLLFILSKE